MKAKHIMRPAPMTVDTIDSLGDAYDLMRAHAIRHVPVIHAGTLVGILSERDILEYRVSLGFDQDWRTYGVSGAMTATPNTAGPEDGVVELAERLARGRFDALPIVERGALVGIVTAADVLAAAIGPAPVTSPRRGTAAQVMTPGPFTARPDESLIAATKRMRVHGVRHLPVVDADARVLGMLSELGLRTTVGDPSRFLTGDASRLTVGDAMAAAPPAVALDHPLTELAKLFEDGKTDAVPVVDRLQRLVGIVSYVDALHALTADRAAPPR